jgi:hypothetical protein
LARFFEEAKANQENWAKYADSLLKSLFSDKSISNKFDDGDISYSRNKDEIETFKREIRDRIRCLESIHQRLPLFP